MKITLFEFKKIIRKIIKEDLLSIDRSGVVQTIEQNKDKRNIYSYFDEYVKIENHNNIVLIEVKDLDTKVMREPFFTTTRNEIINIKLKEQLNKFPGKIVFIINSNYFENIGKQLFYNYLQQNQGIQNFDDLKEIDFSFAFWLMHDIGHSIVDRNIFNFDNDVSNLTKYLRDNKFSKRSIITSTIKYFIFDILKINKESLIDFHSSDVSDTIQNLIFISYLHAEELENRIEQINFEKFITHRLINNKQINPDFNKEIHANNINNMFSNIRNEIKYLIKKIKERLKDHNTVTLIGMSPEELNNYSFIDN